jgi:heme-NO-binding protein
VHGLIFTSFRDYLTEAHGAEAAAKLFAGEPIYLLSEAYPDERLLALIGRASEASGQDADTIVHDFGVYTAQYTFTRLYPALFAIAGSSRDFLLTVEDRIHELVRATIPNAGPPQLDVGELDGDGVSIVYTSPRKLCVLLRGLTEGTALHYGERAEIEEKTCMLRGDPACTFKVRFTPGNA